MPRSDPSRIGRYEIRRERGRGAMGVVYEAYDPTLGRTVALKTISLPVGATAEDFQAFEKRFFAEARIAARLSHPGIVVVHDAARDPATGTLYMALEYLEGRTLAEIVSGEVAVSWREALRITARIAAALQHAHSNGVVHRDIKPSNIMILADGEPKIMDFGIAKVEAARIKLTIAGQLLGTPLYMSPEQILGHEVDARSDLFSLGAIAYCLLTGRAAFAAENKTKIVGRVVHHQPTPPSVLIPGLPPGVDSIIGRAMAKDPAERYPDGKTLAEDVADILAGRPLREGKAVRAGDPREGLAEDQGEPLLARLEVAIRNASRESPDPDNELDTLFSARAAPPADAAPGWAAGRETGLPSPAALGSAVPPSAGRTTLGRLAAPLAAFLAAATVAGVLLLRKPDNGQVPAPVSDAAPVTTPVAPPATPPLVAPVVTPSVATEVVAAEDTPVATPDVAPVVAGAAPESPLPSPTVGVVAASPGPAASDTPAELAAPAPWPPSLAPREAARAPVPAPASRVARLAVDLEHPLERGTLRVWLGATLVVNEKLESRMTRKFLALKVRKGTFQEVYQVSPGKYPVTVEVRWDDQRRAKRLDGTLEAGSERLLKIRLGAKKDLLVDWD